VGKTCSLHCSSQEQRRRKQRAGRRAGPRAAEASTMPTFLASLLPCSTSVAICQCLLSPSRVDHDRTTASANATNGMARPQPKPPIITVRGWFPEVLQRRRPMRPSAWHLAIGGVRNRGTTQGTRRQLQPMASACHGLMATTSSARGTEVVRRGIRRNANFCHGRVAR
jgi:hypothetical protein